MNNRFIHLACSILIYMLLIDSALYAQQKPHYSQYILNNFIMNPALSGLENYTDIKASYRNQWSGFEGAPVTGYLTVQFPIGNKAFQNSPNAMQIEGENPMGKRYWEDYTASPAHHGLGIQIVNDKIGQFNDFIIKGTYAYHIPIGVKTNISAGVGFGMGSLSLNSQNLNFGNANPVDPSVFTSGQLNKFRANVDAGLWVYSSDYFAGLSVLELVPQKIDFSGNIVKTTEGKWTPHTFFTGGYRFMLTDDFNVVPSFMIKFVNPVPPQLETNVKVQYQNSFWFGAGSRYKYGFIAFAGLNLFNGIQLSYSYDYSTTRLNTVSNGTHEILIGFISRKKMEQFCPKNVW